MVHSVLEANPISIQIEPDQVVLDTPFGSKASLKSPGVAPGENLVEGAEYIPSPTTQDSCPAGGNLESLPPGGSNTKTRGLWHLLSKSMCRLGRHQGKWEYLTETECSQSRVCNQCGDADVRIRHRLMWKYRGENTCEQAKTCSRCNIVPMQTVFLSLDCLVHDHGIPGDRSVDIPTDGYQIRHQNWSRPWEVERRWWQSSKRGHRCLRCGMVEEWEDSD